MSGLIEILIYVVGCLGSTVLLLWGTVLALKLIFKALHRIKKTDFAWMLVVSAKRRNESAEDILDEVISLCDTQSQWVLTEKKKDCIRRVVKRIERYELKLKEQG